MDPNIAKGICIGILLSVTIFFGCLPHSLLAQSGASSLRAVNLRQKIVSYLSCFAGGVFLSVCLLHLLADGTKDMHEYFNEIGEEVDFPVFEAITGAGFFLIAAVEQAAHKLLSGDHGHSHSHSPSDDNKNNTVVMTIDKEVEMTEVPKQASGKPETQRQHKADMANWTVTKGDELHVNDVIDSFQSSPTKAFLLLTALSFHTVFDGLAVGLQTSTYSIWQMFIAVILHKCLVSFCLGLQLFTVFKHKPVRAFWWICFFAFVSPIGVGVGMSVTSGAVDDLAKSLVATILNGVATGAFLYVTFFEILREELMAKPGFLRLLAVVIGFTTMAVPKVLEVLV